MLKPLALLLLVTGCATAPASTSCPAESIRSAIAAEVEKGVEATRRKDIDAFMDGVPEDFRMVGDNGAVTDKAALRAQILQSWSIIDRTIDIDVAIDKVEIAPSCAEAKVYTSQRWERIMQRRDASGSDNVVTTQKHIEHWRTREGRWYNYEITELGGEIFVNGELYVP